MSTRAKARCVEASLASEGAMVFRLHTAMEHGLYPGRYITIEHPDTRGVRQERCYSIVRKPAPGVIEIAVKRTGTGGVSDSLHESIEEGGLVSVTGLGGHITVHAVQQFQQVLMLAGGIGVTLPVALLSELAKLDQAGDFVPRVALYLCSRNLAAVPFLNELLDLSLRTRWFTLQVFITRGGVQNRSPIFRPGRSAEDDLREVGQPDAVVICGSHGFASDMHQTARRVFSNHRLFVESFSVPAAQENIHIGATDGQAAEKTSLTVRGLRFPADPSKTVLEHLETNGISIRSQCRSGICGNCRIQILAGECTRKADFALSDTERLNGYALACCTYPKRGELSITF